MDSTTQRSIPKSAWHTLYMMRLMRECFWNGNNGWLSGLNSLSNNYWLLSQHWTLFRITRHGPRCCCGLLFHIHLIDRLACAFRASTYLLTNRSATSLANTNSPVPPQIICTYAPSFTTASLLILGNTPSEALLKTSSKHPKGKLLICWLSWVAQYLMRSAVLHLCNISDR